MTEALAERAGKETPPLACAVVANAVRLRAESAGKFFERFRPRPLRQGERRVSAVLKFHLFLVGKTKGAVMVRKSKEQLEAPRRNKGSNGRKRKRNQEREDVETVQIKQRRTEAKITSQSTGVLNVTSAQQAKRQLLSKSTTEHLEATMHWLIMSLLYETTQKHSEIKKHLNLLKIRLLNSFETLQVPVEKLSNWENVHKILPKEKKKSVAIEKGLEELQKELDNVFQIAEFRNMNIESFQKKLQGLKCELAAEKAAASKLFQRDGKDDLALPSISEDCLKIPILQNELLRVRNQQVLLNDLNAIQQSDEMKTMSTFLEQLYENMDF